MLIETKAGLMPLITPFLYLPFVLLQINPQGIDILSIADKIGVIAILLYMSYTLNNRMEKMFSEFQTQLKEEREKSDQIQKELIQKILDLVSKKIE